jgi:hypothetical protein
LPWLQGADVVSVVVSTERQLETLEDGDSDGQDACEKCARQLSPAFVATMKVNQDLIEKRRNLYKEMQRQCFVIARDQ